MNILKFFLLYFTLSTKLISMLPSSYLAHFLVLLHGPHFLKLKLSCLGILKLLLVKSHHALVQDVKRVHHQSVCPGEAIISGLSVISVDKLFLFLLPSINKIWYVSCILLKKLKPWVFFLFDMIVMKKSLIVICLFDSFDTYFTHLFTYSRLI